MDNNILNSTSAGASTLDHFNHDQNGQEEYVFEDPDYRVPNPLHTVSQTSHAARGGPGFLSSLRGLGRSLNGSSRLSRRESGQVWGINVDVDAEKGEVVETSVVKSDDSGVPGRIENAG